MVAVLNSDCATVRLETVAHGETRLSSGRAEPCTVQDERYRLSAGDGLLRLVPEIRDVNFRVLETADGTRRFLATPEDGFDGLIDRAFSFGLALLTHERGLDTATVESYRIAKIAFDFVQRTQEPIRLTLHSVYDFSVHRSHRGLIGRDHLLPETANDARRLTFRDLENAGRHAAENDGYHLPTSSVVVRHGLHQAGLMNPLSASSPEIPSLIRLALFDLSQLPSQVSAEHRRIVESKFASLVQSHAADPPCQFRRWLSGGNSNLLGSLANRKDSRGAKLGRDVAKRAMLDLGWEASFRIAECLEAVGSALAQSLGRPLDADERTSFEGTFYRQAHLGGLSLALLAGRGRMLQPALEALWSRPDDSQQIGALHRQLHHFGEVVPAMRQIERAKKQRRRSTASLARIDERRIQSLDGASPLDDMLSEVVERRGLECPICRCTPVPQPCVGGIRRGVSLDLELYCERHGRCGETVVSWSELIAADQVLRE
jgi:hypothetical protein